jgi:hypothetical protein
MWGEERERWGERERKGSERVFIDGGPLRMKVDKDVEFFCSSFFVQVFPKIAPSLIV